MVTFVQVYRTPARCSQVDNASLKSQILNTSLIKYYADIRILQIYT